MKQSFELRLGQSLTMTPALQQAIKLLQLSTVELELEIQDALESNIMLEEAPSEFDPTNGDSPSTNDSENGDIVASPSESDTSLENLPEEIPADYSWDDIYDTPVKKNTGTEENDGLPLVERLGDASNQSLTGHLLWQLELSLLSPRDRQLAATVIDALDEDGYLRSPLEAIFTGYIDDQQEEPTTEEMALALKQVQQFDPIGVGARDLRECLLLQLLNSESHAANDPVHDLAVTVIDQHLETLGNADIARLRRQLNVDSNDITAVIQLVRGLDPKPGSRFNQNTAEYIAPDVYVKRHGLMWVAELTAGANTSLRVNAEYEALAKKIKGDDAEIMKSHLQEARWFIKSLQSRNDTLMKVANSIVLRQHNFFEKGDESLVPMVLRDVAEDVEMHESTISRITSSKYMHTPFGVLPFKYFFSSHVGTSDGGEAAATAIQAMIKKLVATEPPHKPLSDTALVKLLAERDIEIARRTVAKYREALSIPPSHARKRLA